MNWIILLLALIAAAPTASPTPTLIWPTPTSPASPFVGVTPQPTPVPQPPVPSAVLCFQQNANPILFCGQDILIAAGDTIGEGISIGPPVNGAPVGPWPATVSLTVNTVTYPTVPVNQTNGLLGFATVPGLQVLTVRINGTPTLNGTVQMVTTH